jgi:mRNA-degrading endonuclease RelE of RelBE toxin-antitoxin system
MKPEFSQNFLDALDKLPLSIQKKFEKQLRFLTSDIRHPSLRAKKYGGSTSIWQARIDKSVRFYFLIEENTYILIDIRYHD